MNTSRFDAVTRRLGFRFSRRAAVRSAGLGAVVASGVGAVAGTMTRPVRAQDPPATPDASGAADADGRTEFLFVQTFESGTWAPKEGEDEVYLLTLTGDAAQTVYFSDRPERIAGAAPTDQFLANLGFTAENPPNAALVAQTDAGEDVVVIELFSPVYGDLGADGGATVTYEARVLAGYQEDGLAHLAARQGDGILPASFGPASLFIDDCPDQDVWCVDRFGAWVGDLGPQGTCWSWCDWQCHWCREPGSFVGDCGQFASKCSGGNCGAAWNCCTTGAPDC